MFRRTGVLVVALALCTAACSSGDDSHRVATVAPKKKATTTTELVTTTTAAVIAAPRVAGTHIQRVRTLPAAESEPRAPRAPKTAAYRGPTPTGRIEIPRIGLNHLTYEGIDLSTIDYGPSHWPGTALPGQTGNTVFPGHRVTHDHPFFDIDLIQVGDAVTFVNSSGRYTYQVTQTFVVNADETWIADPTDGPTMTIFGCHPKHSAKQRYVVKGNLVKAERTPGSSEPKAATGNGDGNGDYSTAPDPAAPPETTTTTAPPKKGLGGLLGGG